MAFSSHQGDYTKAETHLRSCLTAVGRPMPTSKLDLTASLFWHTLRQVLHSLYIGRWLSSLAGGIRNSPTKGDVKSSARDSALVYHKLHQLHLTGHGSSGAMSSINLALCAVNLAEASADAMSTETMAEIYTTAAIDIKLNLPSIQFLAVSSN